MKMEGKKAGLMPSSNGEAQTNATKSKPVIKKTGSTDGKPNALGGGGRFQQMVNSGKSPALAAFIGRKMYGAKKMANMSAAGKSGK